MIPDGRGPLAGQPASFGRRLAAAVIDSLLVAALNRAVTSLLAPAVGEDPGAPVVLMLLLGVALADGLLYYTLTEGASAGQTAGKRLLGIRVVRHDGTRLGLGRAAVRFVGRIPSALALLLGYLWMLWDDRRQTWHDKLAGSVVVRVAGSVPAP